MNILFSNFCLQLKVWAFKINILAHELLIDTRKCFNFVFRIVCCASSKWAFRSWLLSSLTWIILPTISLGKNQVIQDPIVPSCQSSAPEIFLLIFFVQLFWVGLGRILLWTLKTTCFPLNFFSSSHTNWTWVFWKDFSWGMGTKIAIAFWPPPTSSSWLLLYSASLVEPWVPSWSQTPGEPGRCQIPAPASCHRASQS